jgi:hypothetical protein
MSVSHSNGKPVVGSATLALFQKGQHTRDAVTLSHELAEKGEPRIVIDLGDDSDKARLHGPVFDRAFGGR